MNPSDQELLNRAYQKMRERELDPDNLNQAENLLLEIVTHSPVAKAYGILSMVYYWKGEEPEKKDKIPIYQKGVEFGKIGISIDPNNVDSHFWLAVNYGLLGLEQGLMSSYMLLEPTEKHFQKALALDETYFYGGPHRAYGWFFHEIPSWPIAKGDKKKALLHLEKSLLYGPDFYLTHVYLAKLYFHSGNKIKALEKINWVLDAKLHPLFTKEQNRYKEEMRILKSKL